MCGACYVTFADAAGSSAPFVAAGAAVARNRWQGALGRLRAACRPRRRRYGLLRLGDRPARVPLLGRREVADELGLVQGFAWSRCPARH